MTITMPKPAPQRWVRISRPVPQPRIYPSAHIPAPEPEYDLDTVRQAIQAAGDIGRYDIAQQIVEEAGADLCVYCTETLATEELPGDDGAILQVCSDCAAEFRG